MDAHWTTTHSEGDVLAGSGRRGIDVEALFDDNYLSLRRLAFVMTGDAHAAEEVVQEAFVKTCSRPRLFARIEHPASYLRQMVVNLCRGRMRRTRIEHRVNALVHRDDPVAGWEAARSDVSLDLWNAVMALAERQRAAVVLFYLEDLPETEVADLLGCSVGTIKSQLSKARAHLGRALSEGAVGGEQR